MSKKITQAGFSKFKRQKIPQIVINKDNEWIGATNLIVRLEEPAKIASTNEEDTQSMRLVEEELGLTDRKTKTKQNAKNGKSTVELMANILKNYGQINPFYNLQTNQLLFTLLTNQQRRNDYIEKLEEETNDQPPEISKNYEILSLLLKKMCENQIQVNHEKEDFELDFNRRTIERKEYEIEELKKRLARKENQITDISTEYESIILNLTDTIKQLSEEEEQQIRQRKKSVRFEQQ